MKLITTIIYDNGIKSTYETDYTKETETELNEAAEIIDEIYKSNGKGYITLPTKSESGGVFINLTKTSSIEFEVKEESK
ncbi:hypothetical protein HBP98_00880 [Listeria booriae]|uniref:Uncharacterized protein n=1 Tax=Listeria booriae TaxID=1552123 RepID=A0A7X1A3F3_9LIST|nr:hypothetical protein [Listeria booriae]MBC2370547.1 hypothetical protein [Listeria booriae]